MGNKAPSDVIYTRELDQIFDVLGKHWRRVILLMLNNGAIENETDLVVRGERDERGLQAQLVHTHLPKLADAGYIEWDRETGEISKGARFDEIAPLLELLENHADELPPDWP